MKVTFVELLQTAILLLPSDQLHTIRLSTPLNTTRQRQITPREILSRLLGVVNDNNLFLPNPIRVHLSKFYAIFCRALSLSSPSSRAFTLLEERLASPGWTSGSFSGIECSLLPGLNFPVASAVWRKRSFVFTSGWVWAVSRQLRNIHLAKAPQHFQCVAALLEFPIYNSSWECWPGFKHLFE